MDAGHGTLYSYESLKCRCKFCFQAYKAYKALHLKAMTNNSDDSRHGTSTGYGYGCRCDKCKTAKSVANRRYHGRDT